MESRELGFEFRFYPKCFHFCPWVTHLSHPLFLKQRQQYKDFQVCGGLPAPTLFKDQLELVNACKILDTCKMVHT